MKIYMQVDGKNPVIHPDCTNDPTIAKLAGMQFAQFIMNSADSRWVEGLKERLNKPQEKHCKCPYCGKGGARVHGKNDIIFDCGSMLVEGVFRRDDARCYLFSLPVFTDTRRFFIPGREKAYGRFGAMGYRELEKFRFVDGGWHGYWNDMPTRMFFANVDAVDPEPPTHVDVMA